MAQVTLQEHKTVVKQTKEFAENQRPALLKRLEKVTRNRFYLAVNRNYQCYEPSGRAVLLPGATIPDNVIGVVGAQPQRRYYVLTKEMVEAPNFPPALGIEVETYLAVEDYNKKVRKHNKTPEDQRGPDWRPMKLKKHPNVIKIFGRRMPRIEVGTEEDYLRGQSMENVLASPVPEFKVDQLGDVYSPGEVPPSSKAVDTSAPFAPLPLGVG